MKLGKFVLSTKKTVIFSLCTAVIFSLAIILPVLADASLPVISLNVSKKIDIAIAAGPTDVNYANLGTDLKTAIDAYAQSKGKQTIPASDLNIMSTKSMSTNSNSAFSWWNYDHSTTANLNETNHQYVEKTPDTNSNAYNTNVSHMVESNSGSALEFFGYGQSGFKDFKIFPNNQATKKTFTFDIIENTASDALDGVGFFINTEITGSYTAGTQVLNGYLLFFQYNGCNGTTIYLFKCTNLNTKTFHTSSYGLSAFTYSIPGISTVATATYGNFKYRKFKVVAEPTKLTLQYEGSSTAISKTYDQLNTVSWSTGGTSVALTKISNTAGSFGPLGSYGGHNCPALTNLKLTNLSMQFDMVRSLTEVVREPSWGQNTHKFLVNINSDEITDFNSSSIVSELLNRLKNDDIYYVGWCSATNVDASTTFLNKNNLKGAVVNTNATETNTYAKQVAAIAKSICDRYWLDIESIGNTVLVTDNTKLYISGQDIVNTEDETYPNGKWKIVHDITGFNSSSYGYFEYNGQYTSNLDCAFNKPGVYRIYYKSDLVKTITAHRAPVAAFDTTNDGAVSGNTITYTSTSSDPDGRGALSEEWTYQDVNDASGTVHNGKITTLTSGQVYLATLKVTDADGAVSSISKQISYVAGASSSTVPPYADFEIDISTISKKTGTSDYYIAVNNKSYDPANLPITASTFTLVNPSGAASTLTLDGQNRIRLTSPADGAYTIKLKVTNSNGTDSAVISRVFNVVSDTAAPTVAFSPNPSGSVVQKYEVSMTFSDAGGSGFQKQRVALTNSATAPADGDTAWSTWSNSTVKTVTINKTGSSYIHYQAYDNSDNLLTGSKGAYLVDATAPAATVDPATITNSTTSFSVAYSFTDATGNFYRQRTAVTGSDELMSDDNAAWGGWSANSSGTIAIADKGTFYIQYQAVDTVGNVLKGVAGPYSTAKIDTGTDLSMESLVSNNALAGIKLTATITAAGYTPAGTVDFYLGNGTRIAAAVPVVNGIAQTTWTGASMFTNYTIYAQYSGNNEYYKSTSMSGSIRTPAILGLVKSSSGNWADALTYSYPTAKVITYTVTNPASSSVSNIKAVLSGANASDFVVGSLPSTTLAAGASMNITVTFPTGKNAGSYSASLLLTSDNASLGYTLGLSQTVNRAAAVITAPNAADRTFDAKPYVMDSPSQITTGTGTVTYSYEGVNATSYGPGSTAPTNAGTYKLTAYLAQSDNYYATQAATVNFSISKKPVTTDMIADMDVFYYTSNQVKPAPAVSFTNAANTLTTLSGAGDYAYTYGTNINVGQGSVTVTGSGNYQGFASKNFTISYIDNPVNPYTIPSVNASGWYTDDIAITANPDWLISTDGINWSAAVTPSLAEGSSVQKTIYLKDKANGYITDAILISGLKVDKVNPVITGVTPAKTEWTNSNVTVSFHSSDATSGIRSVKVLGGNFTTATDVSLDNGVYSFAAEQNATYTVTATDHAGRTASASIDIGNIDKAAPEVPSITSGASDNWKNSAVMVALTSADALSGMASFEYSTNAGNTWSSPAVWQASNTFVITADGNYSNNVLVRVKDCAGNTSTSQLYTVLLDTVKPDVNMITYTIHKTDNTLPYVPGFYNTGITFDIAATDTLSGIGRIEYQFVADGSAVTSTWLTYDSENKPSLPAADYKGRIVIRAVDNASNVSYNKTGDLMTVDVDNPKITGITDGAAYYVDRIVTASDTNLYTLKMNGTDFISGSKIAGNQSGVAYTIAATDKAGNQTVIVVKAQTIASIAENINSITVGNVKSNAFDPITLVRANAADVLANQADNGATSLQKEELSAIIANSDALLAKIQQITADISGGNTKIGTLTNGITVENVKSSDKANLDSAIAIIGNLLTTYPNNLTDPEKTALDNKKTFISDLLARILKINGDIANISTKTGSITKDNVKGTDKTNLESALAIIDDLLANYAGNLTPEEKKALENQKNNVTDSLSRIIRIKSSIADVRTKTDGITRNNVKRSDRANLESSLGTVNDLLTNYAKNLTAEETTALTQTLADIKDLLSLLDEVEKIDALIKGLPGAEEALTDDRTKAIQEIYTLYNKLTDYQKSLLELPVLDKIEKSADNVKSLLLYNKDNEIGVEEEEGTKLDINTELVVNNITDTLDAETKSRFAVNVDKAADGNTIAGLYDIKLLLEGQPVQPDGKVKIRIKLTEEMAKYTGLQITYIADDGTVTIIPHEIVDGYIVFVTDHFSNYAVIGKLPMSALQAAGIAVAVIVVLAGLFWLFLLIKRKREKESKETA